MTDAETVSPLPRPAFLTADWLRAHGVDNGESFWHALRPEEVVCAPQTMRAAKSTRLGFTNSLMRRMRREGWAITLRLADLQATGEGMIVYDIAAGETAFTFIAWCEAGGEEDRLGRFYEVDYDFYGSLREGRTPTGLARDEAERMRRNVWRGRTDNGCLGWTVANRSKRLFAEVVETLAAGRQPDPARIAEGGGYILRNAGWYGNGRHGSRSWLSLPPDHPFAAPYHVDLFALYMWRLVAAEAANTIAAKLAPRRAVRLDAGIAGYLGVGNSSGIGMVATLVRWPTWFASYNFLREAVIARAVIRDSVAPEAAARMARLLAQTIAFYDRQPASDLPGIESPAGLSRGLARLAETLRSRVQAKDMGFLWRDLAEAVRAAGSAEVAEQFNALLIEVEAEFADAVEGLLGALMNTPRGIDPAATAGDIRRIIAGRYGWALALDLTTPESRAHFWYKSEENGENRRGERAVDAGAERETFVDVAGIVQELDRRLAALPAQMPIADFLLTWPEYTNAVARILLATRLPYSEVQANILHRDFLPMDGIRYLLGIYGLQYSLPYSTRWVRGVFYQGAPLPGADGRLQSDPAIFPVLDLPRPEEVSA